MTMVVKAEADRLALPGLQNGQSYLVSQAGGGWWVVPEAEAPPPDRRREWAGPKRDLIEHLDAMAAEGFTLEPQLGTEVGPCRF